jgi:uncharacterized OB-fold protein
MSEALDHPAINAETRTYWEGARSGKLMIKSCRSCGKAHMYPRAQCPHCRSLDTEWVEASGNGEIYSWTVMRRAAPPFAIAYVTLEEDVTMFTSIVDCDLDALSVGDKVVVAFETKEDGLIVPVFKPV